MEVRDAIFGKQFGRYTHGKVITLLAYLHPDVEGRHHRVLPCIAYPTDADAFRVMNPCLHKGPDHIEAPYYTVRELC